jgi:putative membrane protein
VAEPDDTSARTRDHLANERTYLAWLRTAANVMVLGVAVAKLVQGGGARSLAAGIILVAVGVAGVVYSGLRYHTGAADIANQRTNIAVGTTGPLVAGAVLIIAVAMAVVLLVW